MNDRVILISRKAKALLAHSISVVVFTLLLSPLVPAANDSVNDLWFAHSFDATSAIGTYFLKQEAYFSVGKFLRQVGIERELGPQWNRDNPWWRQAEEALIERVEPGVIVN